MILSRLFRALQHSIDGLEYALKSEFAFRLEVFLFAILLPVAFFISHLAVERVLLVGSLLLVFISELINSALEACIDRISDAHHPLSKAAKDLGSAAVLVSCVLVLFTWGLIIFC
jgi:diacylglycerol kinase (ATP)